MIKKVWFWDLETLNIFTATFVDRDSDETRIFVISNNRNDKKELFKFLDTEVAYLIGYNSLTFDAQIIEYLYRNPLAEAENIRLYAQIITEDFNRRPDVPEWKLRHKHLDLFRALSLAVSAKRTGLKWCEYMIDFENIEDMPNEAQGDNWEEMVLSYNLNDVLATKALYFKYKHEIILRKQLTEKEGVNLMNSTEPDMAKKLFSKYLCKAMNITQNDLKSMFTSRSVVKVEDVLLPYIQFKSPVLQEILSKFKNLELTEFDEFNYEVEYSKINLSYGLGGLHGSIKKKIVESSEGYIIKSADVKSYYPNLAIRNRWSPAHLPNEIFCNLYEGFYNQRIAIPKSDPSNYALKILLNSAYGLSNDKFSFLRDRQLTVAICVNGQLLLTMLFESILDKIPNSKLLVANTDGCEILIPKQYEPLYFSICKEWENLTKMELEYADYSKIIAYDVNNYLAFYTNGKYKAKGRCEFEDIPLHKNKSHNIIPIAVFKYFKDGIPVEETIKNHTNIYDFCAGKKAKKSKSSSLDEESKRGGSHFELHWIENNQLKKKKLSKTVRYYISNKGQYLFKCYEDGTVEHAEAPAKKGNLKKEWKVTYFNKYIKKDIKEYDINYQYYIMQANEWINSFGDSKQIKLF